MTDVNRRRLAGGLAIAGVSGAASALAQPRELKISDLKKETETACAYHCDFGDPRRIGQMLTNINNHLSAHDFNPLDVKIVIVTHGQGIKPFLTDLEGTPWAADKPEPELFARTEALAKYGVDVYLCQITFKNNKIDPAKARSAPFIKLVPSGVAAVAALQARGYAYIKVG